MASRGPTKTTTLTMLPREGGRGYTAVREGVNHSDRAAVQQVVGEASVVLRAELGVGALVDDRLNRRLRLGRQFVPGLGLGLGLGLVISLGSQLVPGSGWGQPSGVSSHPLDVSLMLTMTTSSLTV